MKLKEAFSSSFLLKCIFTISLFILIFISSVSYKHAITLAESSKWIVHSYRTDIELEKVLSFIKDAETGQRGFIITKDTNFLEPYFSANEKAEISFGELEKLAHGDFQQENNLKILRQLYNLRFSQLKTSLLISSRTPFDKKLLEANMSIGKKVMDSIRLQINKMIELEKVYLSERQAKYEQEISFTPLITLLFLIFALLVFVFSFLKINKDLRVLKASNANLIIANESTKHAEEIGGFSSWQWNLETNKLIYSDNQYLLLGCEPQSFEPSIEKFLDFVHPLDRHIITGGENQVMNANKYPAAYFRVIRKDGELRYFKSLSKLITDSNGKRTLIGINSDITEQYFSNLTLEERNRELEQMNQELASFNHVASHDLQEPMRIVQTYISRFNGKEMDGVSEKGKEYFGKIKIAVTRMRVLIDDLLLFSRTNKTEKIFEVTDLNQLFDNAIQDLAQIIEEKNATIKSVDLPTLKVIPFQIQQLFTNLITNSIKYSKTDILPLINVACDRISAKDEPWLKNETDKKYYKISISDNGLGFEQQYAEQIFGLFHRLHHDKEYAGTGIGLAICKKIAENHNGFLIAKGEPNLGATFSIFLPA